MCAVFGRRTSIPAKELKLFNGYPHLGDQSQADRPFVPWKEL
jgi:hypothetical protein